MHVGGSGSGAYEKLVAEALAPLEHGATIDGLSAQCDGSRNLTSEVLQTLETQGRAHFDGSRWHAARPSVSTEGRAFVGGVVATAARVRVRRAVEAQQRLDARRPTAARPPPTRRGGAPDRGSATVTATLAGGGRSTPTVGTATPDATAVLVCDDSPAYGHLVCEWLRDAEGLDVVGLVSTFEGLIEHAGRCSPDVVVLDHLLGESTSETTVPALLNVAPNARVLLVSGMPSYALGEIAAGCKAHGFIIKASHPETMRDAIRRVSRCTSPS